MCNVSMKAVNKREQSDKIFLTKQVLCRKGWHFAPNNDKVKGKCHGSGQMWSQEAKQRIALSGCIMWQLMWVVLAVTPLGPGCSAEFRDAQGRKENHGMLTSANIMKSGSGRSVRNSSEWGKSWWMKFNTNSCKVMSIRGKALCAL